MAANTDLAKYGLDPIYSRSKSMEFTGESDDAFDAGKLSKVATRNSTVSLKFKMDKLSGTQALISKDADGDGKGEFTVWVKDGQLIVTLSDGDDGYWVRVPDLILDDDDTYHLAVSMGRDGLQIWLNGELVAAEPDIKVGLEGNKESLVIGGTRAWTDAKNDPHSVADAKISDVMIFDKQLGVEKIVVLAEAADAKIGKQAKMKMNMAELAPILEQLHHGSDNLKEILSEYGVTEHGHFSNPLAMKQGGNAKNKMTGTGDADGLDGRGGNDVIDGKNGDDVLQGGYGNDLLRGGSGNDILDGGHGEDTLNGGDGDDLLISRADGREGKVARDPDRDEGDPYNELTKGKLYPDQPIPADDVMIGGKGADIFYFQTLINAKDYFIEKHTQSDGTIRWHGVAGENDNIHDHWVDVLGGEVIKDFDRSEGDRIVIEGHTTEIDSITYGDADGDGVMDHSIIALYSDQGAGGGAHNDDKLGTITVYGDLVRESDIEHTAAPAYGIVNTIDHLDEAVKPKDKGKDSGPVKAPDDLPKRADFAAANSEKPVFVAAGSHRFRKDDDAPLAFEHRKRLDLKKGTVALDFEIAKLDGYQTLFSKDASGLGKGGHLTVSINEEGDLIVRIQDKEKSYYLTVDDAIKQGKSYDLAVSFGPDGLHVYLNGARVAYDSDLQIGWGKNTEAFIVGASGSSNTPGEIDKTHSHINGKISDVMIFDKQMTAEEIFGKGSRPDREDFKGKVTGFSFDENGQGDLLVKKDGKTTKIEKKATILEFDDFTARADEFEFGGGGDNSISGADTADALFGRGGDDTLRGQRNDDLLVGGSGDDSLSGGSGDDQVIGEGGDDRLSGDDGRDTLKGGAGNDEMYGGDNADKFYGGIGDDTIYGNSWHDGGGSQGDRVYLNGNFKDYNFETVTFYNNARGENVKKLIVTDSADGGKDGVYEGRDHLIDIDQIVFADRTVDVVDLL